MIAQAGAELVILPPQPLRVLGRLMHTAAPCQERGFEKHEAWGWMRTACYQERGGRLALPLTGEGVTFLRGGLWDPVLLEDAGTAF